MLWEPENILVVSQEWYTHYNERPDMDDRDDEYDEEEEEDGEM